MFDLLNGHPLKWQQWKYTPAEGFTIRGWRTAPRGLPVLHFIHGNSYSGLTYMPLWDALGEDFDIVLHDIQGHGDSDVGGKFVGWNRSGDIALEAWQQLKSDYPGVPVYGLGHSFGGVVTGLMHADHGNIFDQLVLLDPIIMPPKMLAWTKPLEFFGLYGQNPIARKSRKRRTVWSSLDEAIETLEGRGMFRGWSEDSLRSYVYFNLEKSDGGWTLKCPPSREGELFSSYAKGMWSRFRRFDTPVHALVGDSTYPFLLDAANYWQLRNPHVHVEVVPGSHCFMLQHPERTARQIKDRLTQT